MRLKKKTTSNCSLSYPPSVVAQFHFCPIRSNDICFRQKLPWMLHLLVLSFFGGVFDTTLKNVESEDEPKTEGKEDFLQLSCFIQQEVKYMHTGLRSKVRSEYIFSGTCWLRNCFVFTVHLIFFCTSSRPVGRKHHQIFRDLGSWRGIPKNIAHFPTSLLSRHPGM